MTPPAQLKVARNLQLPENAVTQTFGILGRKGSGKTYAAGKLAECLLEAGCQTVVLDPVGNWYGLRLDRSGKKPSGFDLPILGGEHGDVPLEPGAGNIVADFLIDTGSSAVLDVSSFRKGQRKDFVATFAEQLFHRKKSRRTPLMLIIEEAQVFAPQRAGHGEERMLGAIEDIVRLGRNYGIGSVMISQRPQSVNKEVLNQAEPLIVFQLVGRHERKAVEDWVVHAGADIDEPLRELPSLQPGDCFVWSPAWLHIFERTRFLQKRTFDASATPKIGEEPSTPQRLSPVNLQSLQTAMADTIERAKADDPKALRAEIARLKKQLADRPAEPDQRAVDQAVAARDRHWNKELARLTSELRDLHSRLQRIAQIADCPEPAEVTVQTPAATPPARPAVRTPAPRTSSQPATATDERLRPAHTRILNALAWLETMGLRTPARSICAAIAGVSPKSSSFSNDVSRLSSLEHLRYPQSGQLELTDSGRSLAEYPTAPPTLEEVQNAWRRCPALRPAHIRLLDVLIEHFPDAVSREQLAEAAGVSPNSSSFSNDVSRLSSMGLATYPDRGMVAAGGDLLFPSI